MSIRITVRDNQKRWKRSIDDMENISRIQSSIDVLEEFRKATLESNIVLDEIISGIHKSRCSGQNIEFLDYRDYVYGDDLRYIDWKLFARSDRFYIKRFDDNKRNKVYLLLDSTQSMNLGEGLFNKYFKAVLLATIMANIFSRFRDDVYLVSNSEMVKLGDAYGTPIIPTMMQVFSQQRFESTDFFSTYESILEFLPKDSILCVFSDLFSDVHRVTEKIKTVSGSGIYQYIFHTMDRSEWSPSVRGLRLFIDPDSGQEMIIQADNIWEEYREVLQKYISDIKDILISTKSGRYIQCLLDRDLREILLELFKR